MGRLPVMPTLNNSVLNRHNVLLRGSTPRRDTSTVRGPSITDTSTPREDGCNFPAALSLSHSPRAGPGGAMKPFQMTPSR